MNSSEVFKNANWIIPNNNCNQPLFRGCFSYSAANRPKNTKLLICGLGFFECYINSQKVSDDKFVPMWTDYNAVERFEREYKITDEFRHRIYYMEYDISSLVEPGKNIIAVALAGGWYTRWKYGSPRLCYRIISELSDGTVKEFYSDNTLKWHPSYIERSVILDGETHDYNIIAENWYYKDFDDSDFLDVVAITAPKSELYKNFCPTDKLIRKIKPVLVKKRRKYSLYDAGENITGVVVVKSDKRKSTAVEINYSEELNSRGNLSYNRKECYGGKQKDIFITDGRKERLMKAEFMWHGFRYFTVSSSAELDSVEVIHTDVKVSSSFKCDNVILNWLYDAYIRTQLMNMHAGIPSDCPHREGRGYTGDGQLVCDCGMLMLDSKEFYRKWLEDIYDCQDLETGHVQYTAPYVCSGGGPGGWGGAVAIVPYTFYKHFGEKQILKQFLPRIELYFKYLEAHSSEGLVVSDQPWSWCLGDWCTPDKITIPEPFVNTYFYVKVLQIYIKILNILEQNEKIAEAEKTLECKKQAINNAYYDEKTACFCANIQGANAFALDIGLGNDRTRAALLENYKKIKMFDTGIFGTDIVSGYLFSTSQSQLAFELLTSHEKTSFFSQISQGATTLWEYWDGHKSRSHPMFGAVVRYLYYYLLGIKQTEASTCFSQLLIEPQLVNGLNECEGSLETEGGFISVKYKKAPKNIDFEIYIENQKAVFVFDSHTYELEKGLNKFSFSL